MTNWRKCKTCNYPIDDSGDTLEKNNDCPDCDPERIPCKCELGPMENCPRHGIAASNDRENNYWKRVNP